jgi:sugar phosphate permease
MGTVGGTFGGRPFAMLVNYVGWQEALLILAAVGMVIMTICWSFIRDKQKPSLISNSNDTDNEPTLIDGLKVVISNPQSWLIGIYGGLMYMPISAFAELWAVPFYKELYGINNELAATISIMMFVGIALGCPIGAWISDCIKSRTRVMAGSALLTMLMFLVVIYVPMSIGMMLFTLFMAGGFCGGQIMYFPANKEINPPHVSGTTAGFTNCLVMVSGIIFQPLLGKVLDFAWDGALNSDGVPYYSVSDYQQALISVPACLITAWAILLFVKDTYPKQQTV